MFPVIIARWWFYAQDVINQSSPFNMVRGWSEEWSDRHACVMGCFAPGYAKYPRRWLPKDCCTCVTKFARDKGVSRCAALDFNQRRGGAGNRHSAVSKTGDAAVKVLNRKTRHTGRGVIVRHGHRKGECGNLHSNPSPSGQTTRSSPWSQSRASEWDISIRFRPMCAKRLQQAEVFFKNLHEVGGRCKRHWQPKCGSSMGLEGKVYRLRIMTMREWKRSAHHC